MTTYLYPRLSRGVALVLLAEVRKVAEEDQRKLGELVAFEHPRAAPVPTGGTVASLSRLADVRKRVMDQVGEWVESGVARGDVAQMDRALGRILHSELEIVPSDASHEGPWNFLSLVVFPDVACARFPDLHDDRLLGTKRNALRRTWSRQEILGELIAEGSPPLGEDELVGLLERTALARNRRLVQALAREVLAYDGPKGRSNFARDLYKRVQYTTGPRLLDVLTDDEMAQHVGKVAVEVWG